MKFAAGRIFVVKSDRLQTADIPDKQKTFSTESDGIITGTWT